MSRLIRGMAIGAVLAACYGKTMPVPLDVSAPEAIPIGFSGKIDPDGSTTLYLPDLEVKIEARNYRQQETRMAWGLIPVPFPPFLFPVLGPADTVSKSSDQHGVEPLTIFVTFVPKEEGFSFNPRAPIVTPDEGSAVSTVEFIGPVDAFCTGVWVNAETSQGYPLPPDESTCFVMRFPFQASPESHFLLSFSGLSIHDDPLTPLDLRYGKFSGSPEE